MEWLLQMLKRNQLSGWFTAEEGPTGGKETDVGRNATGMGTRHVPGKVAETPRPSFVRIPILRRSRLKLSLTGFLLF